ncbi:hypothetical protein XhyaCFBP1156_16115 [Xanthomonas hyacinthi]|uniref:Uncharacterized protein n=1 Tax=Xanthomonas hyacinthi TaxID=56455 RepID=A0A2S7ESP9_9XANT|nr:hypothetical protein XhyaCFBP1156_16115 [Xanthomonas hyacinthi]
MTVLSSHRNTLRSVRCCTWKLSLPCSLKEFDIGGGVAPEQASLNQIVAEYLVITEILPKDH